MQAPDDVTAGKSAAIRGLLLAANKTDKVKATTRAQGEGPAQYDLMGQLAEIYAKAGDFENSLKYYQQRAAIDPNNKEYWYTIGVLCWDRIHNFRSSLSLEDSQKTIDMGVAALEKAIDLDKQYFDGFVYINLICRGRPSPPRPASRSPPATPSADEYRKVAEDLGKHMAARPPPGSALGRRRKPVFDTMLEHQYRCQETVVVFPLALFSTSVIGGIVAAPTSSSRRSRIRTHISSSEV
jgi:tetratricopeptide (TPR) repeat protein